MAFGHGSTADFRLDNSGGALTDISAYVRSATFSPVADTAEVTTLGDTSKDYLAGLKDATLSAEGPFDATADAVLAVAVGAIKSFQYGPLGTTTGNIKYTGECICTSYEISSPVDDAASWSAEFQVLQGWTRGTY